jgi:photosystem II stability/assembly factor-like uncharacterized protein
MADFDELLPEEADERDQRLIRDLHRMYSADAQTTERLAHVRQHLLTKPDGSVDDYKSTQAQHATRNTRNGKLTRATVSWERSWQRRLSMAAAVVFATLLVGSLLLVLSRAHQSNLGGQGNIPPSSKLAGGPGSMFSLHMIDATTGWALSAQGVLRTTDGGLQWQNVSPPSISLTQDSIAEFRSAAVAWVGTKQANKTTAQVLWTTDSGKSWQQTTIQPSFLRQITFVDAQHGWILSSSRPTGGSAEAVNVFRTTDGGKTWQSVSSALFSDATPPGHLPYGGQKSGIHFLNASTGWVTGTVTVANLAWLYVTHNGGSTWNQQTIHMPPGVPSGQLSIAAPTFFSATDGILPITFSDATTGSDIATDIYVTHDGGTTWQSTTPVPLVLGTTDFSDMQHGWATNGTVLYSTSDGGQHWTKLSPSASFKQVTHLDFVSSTTGWAIGRQGNSASSLLKTVDGGQTWTPVS